MTTEYPEPESDIDEFGLTDNEWHDIATDYYFGNTEPAEGSVEAEVFRRLDALTRRENERVHTEREKDEAYARYRGASFPGRPLTAGLSSREAGELSDKLYSAHVKASRAWHEADCRSAESVEFRDMDKDIYDVYRDVATEAIVSGVRIPGESRREFSQRVAHEDPWTPGPRAFELPDPEPDAEPELPW